MRAGNELHQPKKFYSPSFEEGKSGKTANAYLSVKTL